MDNKYYIEKFENKIYLYENGIIVMIMEDLNQTDETIVIGYETIINRFKKGLTNEDRIKM